MFFGRTDAKAETPVPWPPHSKSWLIGKDSDAGRDWGQEEKGTTDDEVAGWHHRLDGHEFGWIPGVGDGQAGLACCSSWGLKESDMTQRPNWTEISFVHFQILDYFPFWRHRHLWIVQEMYRGPYDWCEEERSHKKQSDLAIGQRRNSITCPNWPKG